MVFFYGTDGDGDGDVELDAYFFLRHLISNLLRDVA